MTISKIEAAQRQLETAIRLFFAEGDWVSIHTLAAASFRILRDLAEQHESWGLDKIIGHIPLGGRKLFWRDVNRIANFLKHADKDQNELLTDVDPTINEDFILCGCMLMADLARKSYSISTPMVLFQMFYVAAYPDNFELDSLQEGEIKKFITSCKNVPRPQLISKLREYLNENESAPRGGDTKFH